MLLLLLVMEVSLVVAAIGAAWYAPKLGSPWFRAIELLFGDLARKRALSVMAVGLFVLSAPRFFFPLGPLTEPPFSCEFVDLLGADTFCSRRLSHPPHPPLGGGGGSGGLARGARPGHRRPFLFGGVCFLCFGKLGARGGVLSSAPGGRGLLGGAWGGGGARHSKFSSRVLRCRCCWYW